MPLLLTQAELRPLLHSPELLELAFVRVEKAILHQKHDPPEGGLSARIAYGEGREHDLRVTQLPDAVTLRMAPSYGDPPPASDSSVMLLFDPNDGRLVALVAGDDLDIMRTAIPTAVGVRHLAPRAAKVLALLGSGRQAIGHLRTYLHALPSIEEVRVYDLDHAHHEQFARDMSTELGRAIQPVASARAAVEGADVICPMGLHQTRPFEADWVQPGALIVQLTDDGYSTELGARARIVVPVHQPPSADHPGLAPDPASLRPRVSADLADILVGQAHARERDGEIVLWDMSAPRPWDPPIINWAYKWAVEQQVGTEFQLTDGPLPQPLP